MITPPEDAVAAAGAASSETLAGVDGQVAADLRTGLAEVERRLRAAVASEDSFVAETARYLVDAGGKRFRPMLVLLAAQTGDPSADGVIDSAVAVELTHLATLYHDDVMDDAILRRGTPAANRRWTNSIAILTGDFLFARASEIAANLGLDEVRLLARTLAMLCEGQLRETQGPGPGQDPVAHYLRVVHDKTASLTAASCRLGAQTAGASAGDVAVLERFGEVLGTAFQISDDLLDISAESAKSGKSPGTDLREGIDTLPMLYAREDEDSSPAAVRLRQLLDRDLSDDDPGVAEALSLLRDSPAMRRARAVLAGYSSRCRDLAAQLPPGPVREAHASVALYVTDRSG